MSTRNSIEVIVYHYADRCSPPVGLCRQYFPGVESAAEFLRSQGYLQRSVNEYERPTVRGVGMYRAIITDHRPAPRRDWRRQAVTYTPNAEGV